MTNWSENRVHGSEYIGPLGSLRKRVRSYVQPAATPWGSSWAHIAYLLQRAQHCGLLHAARLLTTSLFYPLLHLPEDIQSHGIRLGPLHD